MKTLVNTGVYGCKIAFISSYFILRSYFFNWTKKNYHAPAPLVFGVELQKAGCIFAHHANNQQSESESNQAE